MSGEKFNSNSKNTAPNPEAEKWENLKDSESTQEQHDEAKDSQINNLENLSSSEISELRDHYNKIFSQSVEKANKLRAEAERERKKQAAIVEILRNLAILEQLDNEANNLPFTISEPEPESEVEAEPAPEEPAEKPLSAMERYEQMLKDRVESGNLKPEEAEDLLQKVQAKADAKKETNPKEIEPEAPEAPATEPDEIPEQVTAENVKWWADWGNNMSDEDKERWLAWSMSKDEENLANLENRIEDLDENDPERTRLEQKYHERQEKSLLDKAEFLDYKIAANEKELKKARAQKASDESLSESNHSDNDVPESHEDLHEPETKPEAKTKAKPEDPQKNKGPNLYYVGADEESLSNFISNPKAESVHIPRYSFLNSQYNQIIGEKKQKQNEQKYNVVKRAADKLKEDIERNYDLIGGEEGVKLLNPQPNAPGVEVADYEKWWNSLSDEGRQKIAEIVDYTERENLLDFDTTSPVNLAFLTWYRGLMNR